MHSGPSSVRKRLKERDDDVVLAYTPALIQQNWTAPFDQEESLMLDRALFFGLSGTVREVCRAMN